MTPKHPLIELKKNRFSWKQARFDPKSQFLRNLFSLKKHPFFAFLWLHMSTTTVFKWPPGPTANYLFLFIIYLGLLIGK